MVKFYYWRQRQKLWISDSISFIEIPICYARLGIECQLWSDIGTDKGTTVLHADFGTENDRRDENGIEGYISGVNVTLVDANPTYVQPSIKMKIIVDGQSDDFISS